LGRWFRHLRLLDEAVRRHPAGTRSPEPGWPIYARPCRCELHIARLDGIEAEHAELLHVSQCVIARDLLPHRKDAR
jgi:hypothetical protein